MDSKNLIEELRNAGPYRDLMRKLQRFTVSIPERVFTEVNGSLDEVHGVWCQDADTLYDKVLGFVGYNSDLTCVY